MTEESRYNGWTNYETWLINLWIGHEQGTQEYWDDVAEDVASEADDKADARDTLADMLKENYEEAQCELTGATGVWQDLLSAALGAVNWREIAGHMLDNSDTYNELTEDRARP